MSIRTSLLLLIVFASFNVLCRAQPGESGVFVTSLQVGGLAVTEACILYLLHFFELLRTSTIVGVTAILFALFGIFFYKDTRKVAAALVCTLALCGVTYFVVVRSPQQSGNTFNVITTSSPSPSPPMIIETRQNTGDDIYRIALIVLVVVLLLGLLIAAIYKLKPKKQPQDAMPAKD